MSKINPNPFTTRPEIEGTFGVVASTHWIATAVGMSMLERGGNAFDAAAATCRSSCMTCGAAKRK
jgi:gamma-glutamyltranspeptidase/glutathione hydrolase